MQKRYWQAAAMCLLLVGGAGAAKASLPQNNSDQTAPDNTKANKQNGPTADQQSENAADRRTTQKIRRSVVQDKNLSTNAHNIKIITQDGNVTLKGPVDTTDEKQNIEDKATAVAGQGHVINQIEIAPPKK